MKMEKQLQECRQAEFDILVAADNADTLAMNCQTAEDYRHLLKNLTTYIRQRTSHVEDDLIQR